LHGDVIKGSSKMGSLFTTEKGCRTGAGRASSNPIDYLVFGICELYIGWIRNIKSDNNKNLPWKGCLRNFATITISCEISRNSAKLLVRNFAKLLVRNFAK
jgi:hypothetical protein